MITSIIQNHLYNNVTVTNHVIERYLQRSSSTLFEQVKRKHRIDYIKQIFVYHLANGLFVVEQACPQRGKNVKRYITPDKQCFVVETGKKGYILITYYTNARYNPQVISVDNYIKWIGRWKKMQRVFQSYLPMVRHGSPHG